MNSRLHLASYALTETTNRKGQPVLKVGRKVAYVALCREAADQFKAGWERETDAFRHWYLFNEIPVGG